MCNSLRQRYGRALHDNHLLLPQYDGQNQSYIYLLCVPIHMLLSKKTIFYENDLISISIHNTNERHMVKLSLRSPSALAV